MGNCEKIQYAVDKNNLLVIYYQQINVSLKHDCGKRDFIEYQAEY